jgi:hypothetical protein
MTLIFDSLVEIMLRSGLTVYEACQLLRQSAVRIAAAKMQRDHGRKSHSQIAAITGLSRAEVARLSKIRGVRHQNRRLSQNPIQRVIAEWHNSSKHLNNLGEPAHLQIFGGQRSFEKLVARVSSGVPVRAMLDEMVRLGVVELLPNQRVRIKSRIAISRGLSEPSIREIGVRASNLIRTLTENLSSSSPLFEASVSANLVDTDRIPMLKREVGNRSTSFLSSIESLLKEVSTSTDLHAARPDSKRVGVGIYYFEESPLVHEPLNSKSTPRRNYRRQKSPPGRSAK